MLLFALPASALERLSFVTGAELDGALGNASCRSDTEGPGLASLAAAVEQASSEATKEGRKVVAKVHLGDFAGPSALGRFLIREPDGPARFAGLVADTGYTAAVAGNVWFDTNAERNAKLAEALSAQGVRMLAANVRCSERADCKALEGMEAPLVTSEGVAFIGLLGDDVFPTIDPRQREGFNQVPVTTALKDRATAARRAGARVVVALVHVSGEAAVAPLVKLAAEATGADLVVVNTVKEASLSVSVVETPKGVPLVVLGYAPWAATRIDFDWDDATSSVTNPRARRVVAGDPVASIRQRVGQVKAVFCEALDAPLTGPLSREVAAEDFLAFALDALRRKAGAEVALINLDAFDSSGFPLPDRVTVADVFNALPFEDRVARATLTGTRLRSLWLSGARTRLGWAGMSERDGQILVNERGLIDSQRYTVVMPDYLANGGGGFLGEPVAFTSLPGKEGKPLQLRPAVLEALRDPEHGLERLLGDDRLDLAGVPRWTWSGALTLAANDTQLDNDAAYDDARLKRSVARAIKGEASGRADAHTRDHALRFTGRARYGQSRVTESGVTNVAETEDQLFGEVLYRLSALQAAWEQAWYAPLPYASLSLDTEFVRNEDAAFRRLEASATAGLRVAPWKPLELKAGAGVRRQLLDPAGRYRWGLEVGYELPRFSPVSLRGLPVDVESGLDYFVSDLLGDKRQEGRFRVRVLLPIGGPVAFTVGFDVFALKQGAQPFAFVTDATLGLTARLDGGQQQF